MIQIDFRKNRVQWLESPRLLTDWYGRATAGFYFTWRYSKLPDVFVSFCIFTFPHVIPCLRALSEIPSAEVSEKKLTILAFLLLFSSAERLLWCNHDDEVAMSGTRAEGLNCWWDKPGGARPYILSHVCTKHGLFLVGVQTGFCSQSWFKCLHSIFVKRSWSSSETCFVWRRCKRRSSVHFLKKYAWVWTPCSHLSHS